MCISSSRYEVRKDIIELPPGERARLAAAVYESAEGGISYMHRGFMSK